jgi:hypothetical protein
MRPHVYNGFIIRGSGDYETIKAHIAHQEQAIKTYRTVQLGGIDRLTKKALTTEQVQGIEARIIAHEEAISERKMALKAYDAERTAPYQGPTRSVDLTMAAGGRTGVAELAYDRAMLTESGAVAVEAHDRTKCHVCGGTIKPGEGHHTAAYSFDTFECMRGFCE